MPASVAKIIGSALLGLLWGLTGCNGQGSKGVAPTEAVAPVSLATSGGNALPEREAVRGEGKSGIAVSASVSAFSALNAPDLADRESRSKAEIMAYMDFLLTLDEDFRDWSARLPLSEAKRKATVLTTSKGYVAYSDRDSRGKLVASEQFCAGLNPKASAVCVPLPPSSRRGATCPHPTPHP